MPPCVPVVLEASAANAAPENAREAANEARTRVCEIFMGRLLGSACPLAKRLRQTKVPARLAGSPRRDHAKSGPHPGVASNCDRRFGHRAALDAANRPRRYSSDVAAVTA